MQNQTPPLHVLHLLQKKGGWCQSISKNARVTSKGSNKRLEAVDCMWLFIKLYAQVYVVMVCVPA